MKVNGMKTRLALKKVSIANLDNLELYRVQKELQFIKSGATETESGSKEIDCATKYEPTCTAELSSYCP